jgi:hypothetical protein
VVFALVYKHFLFEDVEDIGHIGYSRQVHLVLVGVFALIAQEVDVD